MRKRISAADPTKVRVVLVTMDSHLGGSVARAQAALQRDVPGLELVMHAADEWTSDPTALESCKAAIARADIVLAMMLFIDDHIQAVLPTLTARPNRS